jgi:hypothetical protein
MNAMTCYAHDLQCKCLRNTGVLQMLDCEVALERNSDTFVESSVVHLLFVG